MIVQNHVQTFACFLNGAFIVIVLEMGGKRNSPLDTCASRCGEYELSDRPWLDCQCDEACVGNDDCCQDLKFYCTNGYEKTVDVR